MCPAPRRDRATRQSSPRFRYPYMFRPSSGDSILIRPIRFDNVLPFLASLGKGMKIMAEKLQRTEQVITEAELRTMMDDEDDESLANLISKGIVHVRGGAWRRDQDSRWRCWQNPDWSPPDED